MLSSFLLCAFLAVLESTRAMRKAGVREVCCVVSVFSAAEGLLFLGGQEKCNHPEKQTIKGPTSEAYGSIPSQVPAAEKNGDQLISGTYCHLGLPRWLSGKESACQCRRLPMQETQEMKVPSPGQEDLLEEEMATHSSILGWKISWTEEFGRLQFMGSQRVGHD